MFGISEIATAKAWKAWAAGACALLDEHFWQRPIQEDPEQEPNVGASMIRIGFGGKLYCNLKVLDYIKLTIRTGLEVNYTIILRSLTT